MFSPEEIEARIHGQPFVPLRIVTSSGQTFDIYHPDLVMIGRRSLMVGTASDKNPKHYEQVSRLALMHVTALEDLPATAPQVGNGEQ